MKRAMLGALACAIAILIVPSAASAAQSVGGCQLDGTASFSPGLGANAQNFSYSFHGGLSGCQSSEAGAPASGTVSAGEPVTINGQQFQEPVPTGNGGCSSSTTARRSPPANAGEAATSATTATAKAAIAEVSLM